MQAPRTALQTPFRGGRLQSFAQQVVRLASDGLQRRALGEETHLQPLQDIADSGVTQAERMLQLYHGPWKQSLGCTMAVLTSEMDALRGTAFALPAEGIAQCWAVFARVPGTGCALRAYAYSIRSPGNPFALGSMCKLLKTRAKDTMQPSLHLIVMTTTRLFMFAGVR